jgi:hypothetical protein
MASRKATKMKTRNHVGDVAVIRLRYGDGVFTDIRVCGPSLTGLQCRVSSPFSPAYYDCVDVECATDRPIVNQQKAPPAPREVGMLWANRRRSLTRPIQDASAEASVKLSAGVSARRKVPHHAPGTASMSYGLSRPGTTTAVTGIATRETSEPKKESRSQRWRDEESARREYFLYFFSRAPCHNRRVAGGML